MPKMWIPDGKYSIKPTCIRLFSPKWIYKKKVSIMIEDLNSTFPSIAEFYSGRNILITGGTGFMGKVFDRIRNRNPTDLEKIVPIPADLLSPDLGISEDDLQMLKNNVSIIFHSAATIKFEEHLKQSIQLNAGGTYKLLQIAQDMPKLVAFIHVSTAYSNCDRTQIDEKIYPMDVDPLKLMETVEWMDDKMVETITPAMLGKKPNTYTFTKAMAETIIEQHRKHVPVVIVRPSIVTCSWKDPVPGWIDNLNTFTGMILAVSYLKFQYSKGVFRTACVDLEAVTDIIPVDICVNLFIAAAWHCANTMPNEVVVYNSTSGSVNPFHWKDFHQLREIVNQYPSDSFYRCPGGTLRTTEITFLITKYYDHYIPAFFADLFSTITRIPLFPHGWTALGTYRRLEKSMKSLNYFTRHEWHFENKNSEQILKSMNLEDSQKFIVSAKFINWVEYMNTYYLGVKKFILNEDIKNLPRARRNLKIRYAMGCAFQAALFVCTWSLLANFSTSFNDLTTCILETFYAMIAVLHIFLAVFHDRLKIMGVIANFANVIGTSEPGLTLLLSVLTPYPLAVFYRYFLQTKPAIIQNAFFTICGIAIGYFNFGNDIIHSVISVLALYFILLFFGGTVFSVFLSFVFYMTYLIMGYIYTETDQYDIIWTLPQCVLTMRLIALTYDVYDGMKNPASLSADQKKTALKTKPSFLEITGHTFFFGGFMVGPQFSMRRYQDLLSGNLFPDKTPSITFAPGFTRGAAGIMYTLIYQLGVSYLMLDDYLLSPSFDNLHLWKKLLVIGVWGKISISKYLAIWLFAEGSCIITGLTYNGKDKNDRILWDGCANIKIRKFEGSLLFGTVIQSFNINTNVWVAQYIYKRLKFMGSRYISQSVTLIFLAVWHGFHSGYYICFFTEFFVVNMEKGMASVLYRFPSFASFMENQIVRVAFTIFSKIYIFCFIGYCLLPFVMLSYVKWFQVYKSLYFIGHILYCGWPFVGLILSKFVPRTPKPDLKVQ
ncbi:Lysophospholipid acyltransferase 5 [Nymphon striatum]|nr:Lysophospholipid acyltransferase 5 [Nymphon striatum]